MQNLLSLAQKDLPDIFQQTAIEMGVGNPIIVEKDFWVVQLLNFLFSENDFFKNHVFKGGTSLSKCFGLIERFSEDCDITISKSFLGFQQTTQEIGELGDKRRKRYFEELDMATNAHVNKISKILTHKIASQFPGDHWKILIDEKNSQNIIFEYPKLLKPSFYPSDFYVKPKILLEFGCRGDLDPAIEINICTYIEYIYPAIFSKKSVPVNVLTPERTFWEKITLLHMLANQNDQKALQNKMARHYYDVYKLSHSEIAKSAMSNLDLLSSVALHKSVYYKSKQASYETAKPGTLKLIPNDFLLEHVENDYEAMKEMFFGEIVPFSDIVKSLTQLENKLNQSGF